MIELVIVAAARFYREGLALALRNFNGFETIRTAAAPEQVGPNMGTQRRTVALLDVLGMPDGPSAVISLRTRNPAMRVIALGVSEQDSDIVTYAEMGAAGYLTRDHSIAELVRTIESAANGEMRCSPRVASALSSRVAELSAELQPNGPATPLSSREAEIALLLEQGLSNQEISHKLCIALATVKNHVHNILDKLGLPRRADAAAWARRQRLDHSALLRQHRVELPARTSTATAERGTPNVEDGSRSG